VFSYLHFREVGLEGHLSIMPPSISSDPTPQKTPHTTTIGNYQTDRNGRRFRTNKGLRPPDRHIKTGCTVLLINRFRVQVPAGATIDAENHRNGLVQGGSLPGVLEHSGEPSVDRFGPDLLSETGTMSIRTLTCIEPYEIGRRGHGVFQCLTAAASEIVLALNDQSRTRDLLRDTKHVVTAQFGEICPNICNSMGGHTSCKKL